MDRDRDGQVGEALYTQLDEQRITQDPAYSGDPASLWAGDRFELLWGDDRSPSGMYRQTLDAAGQSLGSQSRVQAGGNEPPSARQRWYSARQSST